MGYNAILYNFWKPSFSGLKSTNSSYILDGNKVIYETNGTDEIYYTYDFDGTLISMRLNDTEFYYVSNVFGDIIYLLNSDGDIVVEYRYDAWGNITNQTDT